MCFTCGRRLPIALLVLLLLRAAPPILASPPSLIVLITAEQFRSDYLQLYEKDFSTSGFGRLLSEGAVYPTARYDHLATLSGPDAAILATGAYPAANGIIANRWYDRASRRVVDAVDTERARETAAASPTHLIGSTFADELRLATGGRSRVLAVSGSVEAAVFLAGRRPVGCYWMRPDGTFETSPYYRPALPGWVEEFNALRGAVRAKGRKWVAVGQPEDSVPLRVIEGANAGEVAALYGASPFAVTDTLAVALRAVEAEELGRGQHPDLLIVNVSAPARLAAETGAQSPLMRDMVLQLDRRLASFFDDLDRLVGMENVGVVFTGLHGVGPLPETIREDGLAAGRVDGAEVVTAIDGALRDAYGAQVYVEKFVYPHVYFSKAVHQAAPKRRIEILRTAGEAARRVKGVAGYYSPEIGSTGVSAEDSVRRSWHPDRAGDMALVYEPFYAEDFGGGRGTIWGSSYRYDTDVPLIFLGSGFRNVQIQAVANAADVAPTLSAWLGIAHPSSSSGKVLSDVLLPKPATAFVDPSFVGPPPPTPPSTP